MAQSTLTARGTGGVGAGGGGGAATAPPPDARHGAVGGAEAAAPSLLLQLREAAFMLAALTLLTGVAYPLAITAVARVVFPDAAGGSLVTREGKVIGSKLLGQPFDEPGYFWGRLSATSPAPYSAQASGASNLGPLNPALTAAARARIEALRAADPGNAAPVPVDLVTSSGSGLDPHISPAAAEYQVARVARARGLSEDRVRALVRASTEGRDLGVLGEARVNVLMVNLALDAEKGSESSPWGFHDSSGGGSSSSPFILKLLREAPRPR